MLEIDDHGSLLGAGKSFMPSPIMQIKGAAASGKAA
jgi:hypothetical protein